MGQSIVALSATKGWLFILFFFFLSFFFVYSIYLFIFLLLHGATRGISLPQPEVEPVPHAVEAQSPKHWTAEEFLFLLCVLF